MTNQNYTKTREFSNKPFVRQIAKEYSRFSIVRKMLFGRSPDTEPKNPPPIVMIEPSDLHRATSTSDTQVYRLGHSTLLMKFGADFWLIDPVFSQRVSPFSFAGPKRFHQCPISIDDLPQIKGVILSHNHYDHLDKQAIKKLRHKVEHFITPLGVGRYLEKWGVPNERITELDWHESHQHGDLTVTATPSQHFSGRGLFDTNKSLWASFCLQYQETRIFFGSDSGYFDGFTEIGARYGPFDLIMLENGAYSELWPEMHMTPAQTWRAFKDLGGGTLMPIHNSTFNLSFHSWKEPLEELAKHAASDGMTIHTPRIGEKTCVGVPAVTAPWWEDCD